MTYTSHAQNRLKLPAAEDFVDWGSTFSAIAERPRLLHRVDATKNQNRQDYLMRLAAANNLKGIHALSKALGLTFSSLVSMPPEVLNEFLAGSMDFDASSQKDACAHGQYLVKRGLSSKARVCPKCLVDNLPMDVGFNLAIPVPCRTHGTVPIDMCPECKRPLSYLRHRIEYCNCGLNLRSCESSPVPPWLNLFYAIFTPWHISSSQIQTQEFIARDWRAATLCHLLISPARSQMGGASITSNDFPQIELLMTNWPMSLQSVLKDRLAKAGISKHSVVKPFLKSDSSLLEKEIKALRDSWRCADRKTLTKKRSLHGDSPLRKTGTLSIRRLRHIANLDYEAAKAFLEKGRSDCSGRYPGREIPKEFHLDQEQTTQLTCYLTDTVTLKEAAIRLGAGEHHLRGLAKSRILKCQTLWVKPRSPRFYVDDLEQLLARWHQQALVIPRVIADLVRLDAIPVLTTTGEYSKRWLNFVARIDADEVVVYCASKKQGVSGLYVRGSDLRDCGYPSSVVRQLVNHGEPSHVSSQNVAVS